MKPEISREVRACVHCAHIGFEQEKFVCRAITNTQFDFVQGIHPPMNAYAARAHKGQCGPSGKLWVERPEPEFLTEAARDNLELWPDRPPWHERAGHRMGALVAAPVLAFMAGAFVVADGWRAFRARCGRTWQAWRGIQDNTAPQVVATETQPETVNVAGQPCDVVPVETVVAQPEPAQPEPETPALTEGEIAEVTKPGAEPEPAQGVLVPLDPQPEPEPDTKPQPGIPTGQGLAFAVVVAGLVIIAGFMAADIVSSHSTRAKAFQPCTFGPRANLLHGAQGQEGVRGLRQRPMGLIWFTLPTV